ncbi:hypothetical protein [Streptomyces sp. NPDC005407]|uniref:hypothetical protein n=1 Tax=Streptomyces sp. NPDC005407 TaxID=3155340 RepID=UPI0033A18C20
MHVADLRDQHRRQGGTDAGQLLDGAVAGVVAKPIRDAAVEQGFFGVEFVDQFQ